MNVRSNPKVAEDVKIFTPKQRPDRKFPTRLPFGEKPPLANLSPSASTVFCLKYALGWNFTISQLSRFSRSGRLDDLYDDTYNALSKAWEEKNMVDKYGTKCVEIRIHPTNLDEVIGYGITSNESPALLQLAKNENFLRDAKEIFGQEDLPRWFLQV